MDHRQEHDPCDQTATGNTSDPLSDQTLLDLLVALRRQADQNDAPILAHTESVCERVDGELEAADQSGTDAELLAEIREIDKQADLADAPFLAHTESVWERVDGELEAADQSGTDMEEE